MEAPRARAAHDAASGPVLWTGDQPLGDYWVTRSKWEHKASLPKEALMGLCSLSGPWMARLRTARAMLAVLRG